MKIYSKIRLKSASNLTEEESKIYYALIDWVNTKGQNPQCRKDIEANWQIGVNYAKLDQRMKVYRGLHFDNADDYNNFLTEFEKDNKKYKSDSLSSWSKDKNIAISYAQKAPFGLVLATWANPGKCIDITKRVMAEWEEQEVLLPKGSYDCQIIESFKDE